MMILHVFEEEHPADQDDHLEYWFGYPEFGPDYNEDDHLQMCFCGASLVPFLSNKDGDIEVATIWHKLRIDSIDVDARDYPDE